MGTRNHKIGSIYSRMTNLLQKKGEMNIKKPLWYDIYTHFPPDREPILRKTVKEETVKQIFYPEDLQRAAIHKALLPKMDPIDLSSNETESQTQHCLKLYNNYIEEGYSEDEALQKVIHSYNTKTENLHEAVTKNIENEIRIDSH